MLDKPMATNARDAAKLVAEARKQGVLFMVGQNFRFSAGDADGEADRREGNPRGGLPREDILDPQGRASRG